MKLLLGIAISYLLGSIPTAYLFGKFYGNIDIREHGSGNVGATNVFRVLGKWPGFAVLFIDIIKGIIPVVLVADILGLNEVLSRIILALSAVSGHNWTIFLKFKGGKGIATSLGVLIGLTIKIAAIRPVLILVLLIWAAVFLTSRIVSLSSIIAAFFLPILMLFTDQEGILVALGVFFCVFVVFRHRPNIHRMLNGQEPRVPLFVKRK